jgi:hypothetical protein
LSTTAFARQDDCNVPMIDWQTRAAVQAMAEALGWKVRRIKTDDGCYEVYGRDQTGRSIEAKIDPGTLAIVEIEFEDDHGEGAEQSEHNDDVPKSDDQEGSDD